MKWPLRFALFAALLSIVPALVHAQDYKKQVIY
jgi:hypothetical protein